MPDLFFKRLDTDPALRVVRQTGCDRKPVVGCGLEGCPVVVCNDVYGLNAVHPAAECRTVGDLIPGIQVLDLPGGIGGASVVDTEANIPVPG